MSNNAKVKLYRNQERNKPIEHKPYIPQYQILGVEPGEYKSAVVPENTKVANPSKDNPRAPRPAVRQPYAARMPSPVGRGKGPIPNVGNNVEHTWSGVDGESIIDDLNPSFKPDPNHPMVDNNDYVSGAVYGYTDEELPTLDEVRSPQHRRFTREEVSAAFNKGVEAAQVRLVPGQVEAFLQRADQDSHPDEDLFSTVHDLEEGTYLLIVQGVSICSGPLEEIQEQARALVFGEHELCDGNPIPDDDIIIIKRVSIRIGLFLE